MFPPKIVTPTPAEEALLETVGSLAEQFGESGFVPREVVAGLFRMTFRTGRASAMFAQLSPWFVETGDDSFIQVRPLTDVHYRLVKGCAPNQVEGWMIGNVLMHWRNGVRDIERRHFLESPGLTNSKESEITLVVVGRSPGTQPLATTEKRGTSTARAARWEDDQPVALRNIGRARKLHGEAMPCRSVLSILERTSERAVPPLRKRSVLQHKNLIACVCSGTGLWDLTEHGQTLYRQYEHIAPTLLDSVLLDLLRRFAA